MSEAGETKRRDPLMNGLVDDYERRGRDQRGRHEVVLDYILKLQTKTAYNFRLMSRTNMVRLSSYKFLFS